MTLSIKIEQALKAIQQQEPGFFAQSLSQADLVAAGRQALSNLDRDMALVRAQSGSLFQSVYADKPEERGDKIANSFVSMRESKPSVLAVICVAAERFGIDPEDKTFKAALMAGIAAEVKLGHAYHSNDHLREVTAMMARLMHVNNELASSQKPGAVLLDGSDLAKGLLAAAAHDLLHDGKGNSPNGPDSHQQYRLEQKAIDAIEPFMKLAGLEQKDSEDVRVMIRITDVTSKKGQKSPHKILTAIYNDFQAKGSSDILLPAELSSIAMDQKLLMLCALMSDSDLGPSTGTNYDFSRMQTRSLSVETKGAIADNNKSVVGFFDFVVGGKLISVAGQAANTAALKAIYDTAKAGAAMEVTAAPAATSATPVSKPAA